MIHTVIQFVKYQLLKNTSSKVIKERRKNPKYVKKKFLKMSFPFGQDLIENGK